MAWRPFPRYMLRRFGVGPNYCAEKSCLDGVDRFGVIPHPDLPVLQLELEQRRGDQLIRSLGVLFGFQ